MNQTFCAINATIFNNVINKNNIPIVYYFDGSSDDLIPDIMKSEKFMDFIYKKVLTQKNGYAYGKISMFYYKDDVYTEQSFYIHDKLQLSYIGNELAHIACADMLLNIFKDLYKKAFDIEIDDDCSHAKQSYGEYSMTVIKSIYDTLIKKYGTRLSFTTIKNYVLKYLYTFEFKNDAGEPFFKLQKPDINYIINDLTNLLTKKYARMD